MNLYCVDILYTSWLEVISTRTKEVVSPTDTIKVTLPLSIAYNADEGLTPKRVRCVACSVAYHAYLFIQINVPYTTVPWVLVFSLRDSLVKVVFPDRAPGKIVQRYGNELESCSLSCIRRCSWPSWRTSRGMVRCSFHRDEPGDRSIKSQTRRLLIQRDCCHYDAAHPIEDAALWTLIHRLHTLRRRQTPTNLRFDKEPIHK